MDVFDNLLSLFELLGICAKGSFGFISKKRIHLLTVAMAEPIRRSSRAIAFGGCR